MSARQLLGDEFLTPAELKFMTGETSVEAQAGVLKGLGVPHRVRGSRILVSRFHTREWLSGRTVTPSRGINLALVK